MNERANNMKPREFFKLTGELREITVQVMSVRIGVKNLLGFR